MTGPAAAPGTAQVFGTGPDVVVVGSVNVDVSVRVEQHPVPGETVLAVGQSRSFGGKGANQAVAAARAGAVVSFVGAVGDDVDGRDSVDNLRAHGIDVSAVSVTTEQPTGTAYITVSAEGENSIIVVAGANATLAPADVDDHLDVLRQARVVVVQLEIPLPVVERVLAVAGRVILNAAPARVLSAELLSTVDVLVVNETEARTLTEARMPTEARTNPPSAHELLAALRALGPRAVVMTLGARGAAWADDVSTGTEPAPPAQVVDTTGAGDAFVGAFAAAQARGAAMAACVQRSVAAASWSTTVAGAQSAPAASDSAGQPNQ